MPSDLPFWKEKPLTELSQSEWESLCDGCGKCCLHKLENDKTAVISFTRVACRLLDLETCRCTQYAKRTVVVPDCIKVRPDIIQNLTWMPATCAYRLLANDQELPAWHPLVSGNSESVHESGTSIRSFAISGEGLTDDDLFSFIISEP